MARTLASSPRAAAALRAVEDLQRSLVAALEEVARGAGAEQRLLPVSWERDEGRHGGGTRFATADGPVFSRASVNVSQVHYDDEPDKRLASATAISAIVHPAHPGAPSMHLHVSFTEMRSGSGSWRVMADLNPSHEDPEATRAFSDALRQAAPELYEAAAAQGDRYFDIPALGRRRGVSHFYLEGFATGDEAADEALARRVGEAAIRAHARLVAEALRRAGPPTAEERERQLAYHTLYLFQVLTLDRGTTAGLLVHDQNDLGILGSLPPRVDRELLAGWVARLPAPQDGLLRAIVAMLGPDRVAVVDDPVKLALARVLRAFHRAHPAAIDQQARGDVLPTTVDNHR